MLALSLTGGLDVVSRTSAFAFKARTIDVGEIGRMLGVTLIVEGSGRRVGRHARVWADQCSRNTYMIVAGPAAVVGVVNSDLIPVA